MTVQEEHRLRLLALGRGGRPFCLCCGEVLGRRREAMLCPSCVAWAAGLRARFRAVLARRSFALLDGGLELTLRRVS